MKAFFAAGLEGSTLCFREFLATIEANELDIGVLSGDLTGRRVVSLIQSAPGSWEVPSDGKTVTVDTPEAFAAVAASFEDRGYYWIEQTREEFERTRSNPLMADLLFKSLARARLQEWLELADSRLGAGEARVFVAPGCGDSPIIDDLLEGSHAMAPCDNRIVAIDGYELVSCSAGGATDFELAREVGERRLHGRLQDLCSGVTNPSCAIFNFQADSRAAQKIVKRYQPALRLLGASHGAAGGARKRGRTLELSPRGELIEDTPRALAGVIVVLEAGKVVDYVFSSGGA
jgi:Icc-related predicted phosphoesterase